MGLALERILEPGLLRLAEEPRTAPLIGPRLDRVGSLLARYAGEIERFNPAYGLVGARTREDLVVRHILDSLAPLGIIAGLLAERPPPGEPGGAAGGGPQEPARIADVGSGAGLPGIPLAIALPEARFTLIERMGRRAGFLRNTIAVLGLDNAAVEEGDMEKAEPGRFGLLCFRAFRPLEAPVLKALYRLLAPGGIIAAYKGRAEAIQAEMEAAGDWAGPWESLSCPVPGLEEERHLVVLRGPPRAGRRVPAAGPEGEP
jgi:16S rRNA (guanine527-N7)-methyltransferase